MSSSGCVNEENNLPFNEEKKILTDFQNNQSFPEKIRMSGLPFMLQGWNNVYHKTDEISDGCPVYNLDSYTLYWFFPIIGVKLFRLNETWRLQRDCDFYPTEIRKYSNEDQKTPMGNWSYGAQVTSV
ncbi:Hypothetical protein HVR_LOCUS1194 [uncultured virus]|nr:Hypothetical protein HVR_LOCUS1194 [uncultured virus]